MKIVIEKAKPHNDISSYEPMDIFEVESGLVLMKISDERYVVLPSGVLLLYECIQPKSRTVKQYLVNLTVQK